MRLGSVTMSILFLGIKGNLHPVSSSTYLEIYLHPESRSTYLEIYTIRQSFGG